MVVTTPVSTSAPGMANQAAPATPAPSTPTPATATRASRTPPTSRPTHSPVRDRRGCSSSASSGGMVWLAGADAPPVPVAEPPVAAPGT